MNAIIQPLPQFDYLDANKEAPFLCLCGHHAPAEIIEYYRHYHVLGCARCSRELALVGHPTSAGEGIDALPQWEQAA